MAAAIVYLDDPTPSWSDAVAIAEPIPTFYLYGEPHRSAAEAFVHVERLVDRSRPSGWTIRPHSHRDLAQILLIDGGGGAMRVDDERHSVPAPCLLVIPERTVHDFAWLDGSSGFVATIAAGQLDALRRRDPDLANVARWPGLAALPAEEVAAARAAMEAMMRELGWAAAGCRAAIEAALLSLLVTCLRHARTMEAGERRGGRRAAIVARFRHRIEERFRLREPIGSHARALGVSETALRGACAAVAASAPATMLDQRALLEAKRLLLYTNLSIAEIGFALGFQDPAYFTRFFTRHEEQAPTAFRRGGRGDGAVVRCR